MSKFCTNCGAELNDGMKFCSGCGTPVPQEAENKRLCSNCGAELKEGMNFCTSCGASAVQGGDNNETIGYAEAVSAQNNTGNASQSYNTGNASQSYNTGNVSQPYNMENSGQPYGNPVQGQYGYNPYMNPPKKKKTGLFIGIGAAVVAVIIAVVGIFGFLAFSGGSGAPSEEKLMAREPFAVSKQDFSDKVEKLIDVSKFEKNDTQYKVSYKWKTVEKTDFDWSVSFEDGSSISLPIKNDELESIGWQTERWATKPVELEVGESDDFDTVLYGPRYKNKKGESIFMDIPLLKDKSITVQKAKYVSVYIKMYDDEMKKEIAPEFTVFGGIKNYSTVEDAIKVRVPSEVSYDKSSGNIELMYNLICNDGTSGIVSLEYSGEKNLMINMQCWNMSVKQ